MRDMPSPDEAVPIADLGVIGDRATAALIDRAGRIVWYCPSRFDRPSLLAHLLDADAGYWAIQVDGAVPQGRSYLGGSGVLQTRLSSPRGTVTLTDFMPLGANAPAGVLCRIISSSAVTRRLVLKPRPDYARGWVSMRRHCAVVLIGDDHRLHSSHAPEVDHETAAITITIPAGESGWAVLASRDLVRPDAALVQTWLDDTVAAWDGLNGILEYDGPYRSALQSSLRAIRLLTYEATGGVVAAVTTSLPEVVGHERNYDYRYVWLRDAGMVASALARIGTESEGPRFLEFLSSTHGDLSAGEQPLAPLVSVAGSEAPREEWLHLAGWGGSRPVRIGNSATAQLQLDAYANLLFAAQAIFDRSGRIPQWPVIEKAAQFLAVHWRDSEAGIWEENASLQHTSSKAIVACGLSYMAAHAPDPEMAAQWLRAVGDIKAFVARSCLTPDGAYAAVAGSETVDVSAFLFSFWRFVQPHDDTLARTTALLDRDYSIGGELYRRHLELDDSLREGVFLAGTLWAAKHWIACGELMRGRRIIDAVIGYSNDLGLLSEEIDLASGKMLGNFPQSFVHAALIGAILDLDRAERETG